MRRTEFITGIQQLHDALVESKLQSLLASMLENADEAPATTQVLAVLKEYAMRARQFNDAAHQLAHLLELDELESPDTWSQLIDQRDSAFVRRQHERVSVVTDYLPQVAALLHRSARQTLEAAGLSHDEAGRITVVVVEEEERLSSPQRLSELFSGLEKLYEVCAVVAGVRGDKLSVLSCESGKDKAFDLVGSPEVINELKNLILSMWDRVVFFRERDLPERIERVAESLFMHERIRTLEQNHTIGPEQAEILRRGLTNGVTKFMEAGALIPEIEERAQYDPRRLMSPEPKLLVSGASEVDRGAPAGASSHPAEHKPAAAPSAPPSPSPEPEPSISSSPSDTTEEPDEERAAPSPLEEVASPPSDKPTRESRQEARPEPSETTGGAGEHQPPPETPAPETTSEETEHPDATPPHHEEPASEEEKSSSDRDGVMEVLEAIAQRHDMEEETETSSSAETRSPEPEQTEQPKESETTPEPSPSEEETTPEEASEETAPRSPGEKETETDELEESGTMKGLNRMFDRIGGGKHLFGNPEEAEDESDENRDQE